MRRPAVPIAVWGTMLAVLLAVFPIAFLPDTETILMFGGAVAGTFLIAAIALAVTGRAAPPELAETDLSYPTVVIALAVSVIAVGLEGGLWLWLIGGGLLLAGVVGVIRERRAERET